MGKGLTYLFTIKQGLIRNKWVVQTKVCPLLVGIEVNISSSNPGALLTYQNVKTGVFHSV